MRLALEPSISVIIPTYNRSELVFRAINSVLGQSWPPLEVIVVDDGSTDGSSEVLGRHFREMIQTGHVRLVTLPNNRGVSAARNAGVQVAKGEWLAFLDSDDEWHSDKLEKQAALIQSRDDLRWLHSDELWFRSGQMLKPKSKHRKFGGDIFQASLGLCLVGASCVLIQRSLFFEAGGFREDFPLCEDYDLWLRLSSKYPIGFVPEALVTKYAGHPNQLSFSQHSMDYWRLKALNSLLSHTPLCLSQRAFVQEALHKKASLLLRGFEKHRNWSRYSEVASWVARSEHSL